MQADPASRKAFAVMAAGALLIVLGIFFTIASEPILVQDFAFVGGQGDQFRIDGNGMVSDAAEFLSPTTGGVLLGTGVALAAGVGGFLLGRRR